MANCNTIVRALRLPGAAQGASSTSEFQFNHAGAAIAEITVPVGVLNKKRFKLVAGGRVTGGTTTNFTAVLHVGTALAADLFTSGAIAVNSASGGWRLEVEGYLDSTSDKITGTGKGVVNATAVAQAIAQATSVDPETALVFGVSGTFSASHASNAAYMDYLELELL